MNLKQLDAMDIVPVSEVTLSVDLDQDGVLTDSVSHIRPRATYVGDAQRGRCGPAAVSQRH